MNLVITKRDDIRLYYRFLSGYSLIFSEEEPIVISNGVVSYIPHIIVREHLLESSFNETRNIP
jgi:predicted aconitase with swiveling domain